MINSSTFPTAPDDWDFLIDNAYNIGPHDRSIKAEEWWVITGMHVRLPEALAGRPAGTSKLLVFADTITGGGAGKSDIQFNDFSDVLLIGDTLDLLNDSTFSRNMPGGDALFRIAVFARRLLSSNGFFFTMQGGRRRGTPTGSPPWTPTWIISSQVFRWYPWSIQGAERIEFFLRGLAAGTPKSERYSYRRLPMPNSGPGFDGCVPFLSRLLLTAQSLFDSNRPDDANRVLARLESLLTLVPGVGSWQMIAAQCAATRELLRPQLPGSDLVPALSPAVYGGVAEAYAPALKAFADRFDQFVDRSIDIERRRQAANLLLKQEDKILQFQALVTRQLEDNLKAATANLDRAQVSMEAQTKRVDDAEAVFQAGLEAWRKATQREADFAIAGAVLSAAVGIASIFAGKPTDLSGLATKAAAAGEKAVKVVKTMEKLAKIVKAVARLVKLIRQILPAISRRINAATLASRMAEVRREAEPWELDGAPSESAYWDQFWVEIETALAPALDHGVGGAPEYVQQLKVLIIYGRALTSAQTAIPPIAQELAQGHLLTKLAAEQSEAIVGQIRSLQTAAPSTLAVALWLRHRSVRRAMFAALQDFDAAHRYWALTTERPQRDPSRPIQNMVDDLLDIADMKVSAQRAFASFNPSPQDFTRIRFEVAAKDVADFLRDGTFALRFTPDFGPVAGWGDVGRVRVHEVAAWVIWNEDPRPGSMEFTIRTDGNYYDQRVQSDEVKEFRFIGPRVNRTFRYDPVTADRSREESISVRAKVAGDFSAQYSQPTLFTSWQFSLPRDKEGTIEREAIEALRGAVKGIELEFSGNYIKDDDRF